MELQNGKTYPWIFVTMLLHVCKWYDACWVIVSHSSKVSKSISIETMVTIAKLSMLFVEKGWKPANYTSYGVPTFMQQFRYDVFEKFRIALRLIRIQIYSESKLSN